MLSQEVSDIEKDHDYKVDINARGKKIYKNDFALFETICKISLKKIETVL